MVTEGVEPSTVALLAQRSNQLSYATFLNFFLTCAPYLEFSSLWPLYEVILWYFAQLIGHFNGLSNITKIKLLAITSDFLWPYFLEISNRGFE